MNPILRWRAVSVAARSVREAESPSRRQIPRTSLAPRESWETKSTLPSTSPRVTGLATSWSAAARRSPSTRSSATRAPSRASSSSRSTPRMTSRVCSKVSRWWYGLCSRPLERESSGRASRSFSTPSGGPSASWRSKSYRFRRAFLRLVFGLGRPFSGPDGLSPLGRLSQAPSAAAVHEGVDQGEDKEEHDGVHEEAQDLLAGLQPKVGLRESDAQEVEQSQVDRDDHRRAPGGVLPVKVLEHPRSSSRRAGG